MPDDRLPKAELKLTEELVGSLRQLKVRWGEQPLCCSRKAEGREEEVLRVEPEGLLYF